MSGDQEPHGKYAYGLRGWERLKIRGQVHHSSMSAGGAIVGASEISVSDGRVLRLDDQSRPLRKQSPHDRMYFVAGELSKDDFEVNEAKVVNFDPW